MVKCISPKNDNMQGIKKFVPARMKTTNYSLKIPNMIQIYYNVVC